MILRLLYSGRVRGVSRDRMQTAARLGMEDSTFSDPAGLDDDTSYKGGPRMSAYDIAIATRNALAGVDPNADLPPLDRAGWLDRTTVQEFRKYAAYLGWKLGDRADYWNTLNEPLVQTTFGYVNIPGLFGAYWPPGAFT